MKVITYNIGALWIWPLQKLKIGCYIWR